MATNNNGILSGRVGPVVFYSLNGKQYARALQQPYTRTSSMKKRSQNFGHAAKLSSLFRWQLEWQTDYPNLTSMQRRLAGAISRWMSTQSIDHLTPNESIVEVDNLKLDSKPSAIVSWKNMVEVMTDQNEGLIVSVRPFAPRGIVSAEVKAARASCNIVAISCNSKTATVRKVVNHSFDFSFKQAEVEAQRIGLDIVPAAGDLTIVFGAISFLDSAGRALEKNGEVVRVGQVIAAMYS